MVPTARVMVTLPSSSGWRMTSSVLRRNSGSSSRNSTPLCARLTSPGPGLRPAAEQAGIADRVMRRAEGAGGDEGARFAEQAARAVDLRRLDRFLLAHAGHDGGDAFGEHGLAGARRSDHQNVVAAGDGDFDGALRILLPFHLAEINVVARVGLEELRGPAGFRRDRLVAAQELDGLAQIRPADDLDALHDAGLRGDCASARAVVCVPGRGLRARWRARRARGAVRR